MDQGLKANPNMRSFLRFTTSGLFMPTGSIHGYDLGSILMSNAAYGLKTEKIPYANAGGVTQFEEPVMVDPNWTIKGNQFPSRIRELLVMGTKQADATQVASPNVFQTIAGVVLGATYRLGVYGATNMVATISGSTKEPVTDYEFDSITGRVRILETGTIAAGSSVLFTYDVPALTMEEYTAFDRQARGGRLYLAGLRSGDLVVNEEWFLDGLLYTNKPGDTDPQKHREWEMKMTTIGNPRLRAMKV